jgi:copper chaperone CopZ
MDPITMWLPWMVGRRWVRIVSACVQDLPGVETVHADPETGMLLVHGNVTAEQIRAALPPFGCEQDDRAVDHHAGGQAERP